MRCWPTSFGWHERIAIAACRCLARISLLLFDQSMRRNIRKLILGKGGSANGGDQRTVNDRWANVVAIWENTYEEDFGLEKVVRLVLALSQFLFPGIYIKHLFWRQGPLVQDLVVELYVMLKTALPLVVLMEGWWSERWLLYLLLWLCAETVLYIPTMIFASDAIANPRSYRRSKILVFINYLEVVFTFAALHMAGQYFNMPIAKWSDAVYLSFVITSTIGFGEYYPVGDAGKLAVSLQSLFYLSYIALFISAFTVSGQRGYFSRLNQ